jgi:metallo-beta-lactamase family protein
VKKPKWVGRERTAGKGLPPVKPLYTENEVEDSMGMLSPYLTTKSLRSLRGLKVRFREAGHILGSSIIETWVCRKQNGDKAVKIVFSGDLVTARRRH